MIFLNLTRYNNSNGKYFEGDLAISRELIKTYYEEPLNAEVSSLHNYDCETCLKDHLYPETTLLYNDHLVVLFQLILTSVQRPLLYKRPLFVIVIGYRVITNSSM